jgi:predicted translin family RNA/ssDNA-binding protein
MKQEKNEKKELVKILKQAIKLVNKNISKAHNFDLEGLSQMLDSYVDDLNEIKKFEIYSFDDDEE